MAGSCSTRRHLFTLGTAPDEPPDVGVEGAELVLHGDEGAGVAHGGLNLGPIADDAGVEEDLLDPLGGEPGHLLHIELGEEATVARPLLEDGQPAQPGLRPFEDEELEVGAVVVHRHSPFGVVIGGVPWTGGPVTAGPVVRNERIGIDGVRAEADGGTARPYAPAAQGHRVEPGTARGAAEGYPTGSAG